MKAKKVMALALAAVMLMCASVAATVAYLKDDDSVVNTFTVGQIGISLDEADVNEYGELLYKDAEKTQLNDRVISNDYKLIPGVTYVKDPTVTVDADSEESYIRMMVEIKDFTDVKAAFGNDFLPQNFVDGWDESKWPCVAIVATNDTAIYEFRYYKTVNTLDKDKTDDVPAQPLKLDPLFTSFTVPADVTGTLLNELEELEINVVAHAIQAAGFDTADLAWAEF